MMLSHHGALDKLKLFHLEDGGFHHQRDYKERTNMKKKIEKYSSEFRKEAVRLALQTEQPKAVIADELGININTLYTWIQKAMQERIDLPKTKNQNISVKYQNLEEENRALRAKIKRIEQERDILKKAAAYFASQDL